MNRPSMVQALLSGLVLVGAGWGWGGPTARKAPAFTVVAKGLDRERKAKGPRGPMHGIPVLLKDNIATADRMQTTAGSLALVGSKPVRDASIVARLRQAGAVILGKTNLSEWANFRSTRSTSGWSARGGLTRNPYALDRNTALSLERTIRSLRQGLYSRTSSSPPLHQTRQP